MLFFLRIGDNMDTQNPTEKQLLDGLLDQLLKNYKKPEDILGKQGLLKRFSKAVLERALGAELTEHLGYEKHDPAGYGTRNARNGTTEKDPEGQERRDYDRGATGPPRHLRAADRQKAPDAL